MPRTQIARFPTDSALFYRRPTGKGNLLTNLRFWPAAISGTVLLTLAFATVGSGFSTVMFIVWAAFSALWLVWAGVVYLLGSPEHVVVRSGPADGTVTLEPLTREEKAIWGNGKPSPLTPAQQAWLDAQKARTATAEHRASKAGTAGAPPRMPAASRSSAPAKRRPSRPPAPRAQPLGVDHRGAEILAAQWMRHLRVLDAVETRHVQDGGIDVDSARYVAQVKHLSGTVGAPDLQRLVGAATVENKHAVFFANTSYTAQALEYAVRANIALFRYDAHEGTIHGENDIAKTAITAGDLGRAFGGT